ncbi:hypothetical protein ACHAWF_015262 [Thalassiosira exigua]
MVSQKARTRSERGPTAWQPTLRLLSSPSVELIGGEKAEATAEDGAIIVDVDRDGGRLTLRFASGSGGQSTYHASWLWANDPKRVILPSGQRTPSSRSRPRIKHARIVRCSLEKDEEVGIDGSGSDGRVRRAEGNGIPGSTATATERLKVPGPTSEDCCHPLAIYGKYQPWMWATALLDGASPTKGASVRPYLQIMWSGPSATSPPDVSSIYDLEWLQRFRYDDRARMEHRERTEVQPMHAVRKDAPPLWYSTPDTVAAMLRSLYRGKDIKAHGPDGLMHVSYRSIIGDDGQVLQQGLFSLLHHVFRDGAAIVSNTPVPDLESPTNKAGDEDLPVEKVAKAMSGGALSHGALYGDVFHVRNGEGGSNNVAYTSTALCPHQDLAYYESPPGMQLLHCVAMGKGVVGGESILLDAMAAAHRLREVRPKSFEHLVRCPATFVKQRDGACMTYRRPHIVLAAEEGGMEMSSVMDREIISVHWSPPFEGPICLPPWQVDEYFEAYADFEEMLNDDTGRNGSNNELSQYAHDFTWEHKLRPGEMLVFNNQRMVHGRRGFSVAPGSSPEDGQRHLVGCYTNIDDTLNSYRVLLRERGLVNNSRASSILNPGNGSNIIP